MQPHVPGEDGPRGAGGATAVDRRVHVGAVLRCGERRQPQRAVWQCFSTKEAHDILLLQFTIMDKTHSIIS